MIQQLPALADSHGQFIRHDIHSPAPPRFFPHEFHPLEADKASAEPQMNACSHEDHEGYSVIPLAPAKQTSRQA
jgi:hypothetical protein